MNLLTKRKVGLDIENRVMVIKRQGGEGKLGVLD